MHRTQVLLETGQYRRLRQMAAEGNTSLGELIRRLIDRFLGDPTKGKSLDSFAGVLKDEDCQSSNYKKFLYPDAG